MERETRRWALCRLRAVRKRRPARNSVRGVVRIEGVVDDPAAVEFEVIFESNPRRAGNAGSRRARLERLRAITGYRRAVQNVVLKEPGKRKWHTSTVDSMRISAVLTLLTSHLV